MNNVILVSTVRLEVYLLEWNVLIILISVDKILDETLMHVYKSITQRVHQVVNYHSVVMGLLLIVLLPKLFTTVYLTVIHVEMVV
jgi:hypothetical protein